MRYISFVAACFAVLVSPLVAQDQRGQQGHSMVMADQMEWTAGPGSLPPGAEMTVLSGDPTKEGVFTMRVRVPANYRIPAHWHPAREHVSVIEGTFSMGMGERFDEAGLHEHGPGDFMAMEPGTRHYVFSREGAIIQLHGMGPWQINYVNAADDPRN